MSPGAPSWWGKSVPVLIALVAVLLYAESLVSPFQYDDWFTVVESTDRLQAGLVLPAEPEESRPVTTASRTVDHAWALVFPDLTRRYPTLGFHLTAILLHALVSVLVWWVVRLWWADPVLAAAAGALFALHPFNAEAVNYISARSSMLAAGGGLVALGAYTLWRKGRGFAWWVVAFGSSAAALGAKESAITLPALLWLVDAMLIAPADSWRARVARLWPWGLLAGGYVAARVILVTDVSGNSGFSQGERAEALATGLWILGVAARDFWWPGHLSAEHGIGVLRGVSAWVTFGVATAVAGAMVWAWRRVGSTATVVAATLFGAAWWVIAGLPTLALPFITHVALYQEHRFYFAAVGLVTLAAYLAIRGGRALATRTGAAAPIGLAIVVLGSLAAIAHARTVAWQSEVALWTDAALKAPSSALAHAMLGSAYLGQDRPDLAVSPLERAVGLDPLYPLAATNLGAAYAKLDRWDDAVAQYRRALALDPDYHLARRNLALAYERLLRWHEAVAQYEILLERLGESSELRLRIGALALRAGDLDEAEASFQAVLAHDPSAAAAALFNLGLVEYRRDRWGPSEGYFRRALALSPGDPDIHYWLGALAAAAGRSEEAINAFDQALALDVGHFVAHYDLARVADALGRPDQAVRHYRRFLATVPADPAWESTRVEVMARLQELSRSVGGP